jgi:hypothetical protein
MLLACGRWLPKSLELAAYPSVCYYQRPVIVQAIPTKGFTMFSDWRYAVSAILFLGSGFLFLYASSLWGLVPAYIVSLPIFAVGVVLVWRALRKPPSL